jgi:acyl-CoA synthetase (NDP forming)
VKLNIASDKAVRDAYADLMEKTQGETLEGVLVGEMINGGVETVVGVVQDDLFGPAIMFGLGGVAVEVYKDVTFRVPPFDIEEARRMIGEIRALPLLQGARGAPKADLNALARTIMRVQRLAMDLSGEIAELDINPLVALPKGCVALDALIVTR